MSVLRRSERRGSTPPTMSGRRRPARAPCPISEQAQAQAQGEQEAAIALVEEDSWQIADGGMLTVHPVEECDPRAHRRAYLDGPRRSVHAGQDPSDRRHQACGSGCGSGYQGLMVRVVVRKGDWRAVVRLVSPTTRTLVLVEAAVSALLRSFGPLVVGSSPTGPTQVVSLPARPRRVVVGLAGPPLGLVTAGPFRPRRAETLRLSICTSHGEGTLEPAMIVHLAGQSREDLPYRDLDDLRARCRSTVAPPAPDDPDASLRGDGSTVRSNRRSCRVTAEHGTTRLGPGSGAARAEKESTRRAPRSRLDRPTPPRRGFRRVTGLTSWRFVALTRWWARRTVGSTGSSENGARRCRGTCVVATWRPAPAS